MTESGQSTLSQFFFFSILLYIQRIRIEQHDKSTSLSINDQQNCGPLDPVGGAFVKIKRLLPIFFLNASNSGVEWRLNIETVTIDSYNKN